MFTNHTPRVYDFLFAFQIEALSRFVYLTPLREQVALVARGKPLEIVTNTASKRKTEMAVNFDRGERNFGSDAYALVSRKPKTTVTKMTTMLGERSSIQGQEGRG